MKLHRSFARWGLLALALLLGALSASSTPDGIEWLDDLDEARLQAAEEGRLILAVFR